MKYNAKAIALKMKPPGPAADDGDGPDAENAADAEDDRTAGVSAMGDFIAAVKSGDAEAAFDAYKDVMALCK